MSTDKSSPKPAATLKQVLERSKLTNAKITLQELPAIDRGLDQIDAQSKKLTSKTASSDESSNIRAHYFLAQGGVNTQVLIKDLGTIHLNGLDEHRQPVQDMDIEGYIEQQQTETVIRMIEDSRQEIMKDTSTSFTTSVDDYWTSVTNDTLHVSNVDTSNLVNFTKAKINQARIVPAGTIV